ncbi:MAG: hypothetical protein AAF657_34185, partial [Acidobacteriota bacterium]
MVRRWNSLGVALLALGFGIYISADAERATSNEDVEHLKRVKVATVEVTTESRELRFSGVTRAARRARLSFLIGGRVVA